MLQPNIHYPRQDVLSDIINPLRRLRIEKQITQDEVDCLMGVSEKQTSRYETGKRTPSLFTLKCWADVLDAQIVIQPYQNDNPELFLLRKDFTEGKNGLEFLDVQGQA